MCHICDETDSNIHHSTQPQQDQQDTSKRSFLKLAATSAIGFALAGSGIGRTAEKNVAVPLKPSVDASGYAKTTPKPKNVISPDEALERLMKGNERYVAGKSRPLDFHDVEASLLKGQNPYATILGCSDSRVSPEHCFDEDHGDLFVVRLAGNYVTPDNVGTIEYSIAMLNTPLIMVLGHEGCGAVEAAISAVDKHTDFPGHIQLMASAIAPAVREVNDKSGDRSINVVKRNVIMNVEKLRTKTPVIDFYNDQRKIRIIGGIYHLKTGKVELVA